MKVMSHELIKTSKPLLETNGAFLKVDGQKKKKKDTEGQTGNAK